MAEYKTFEEMYQETMRAIGDAQYARQDEVKAVVNMVYLTEICQCDELYPLFWLLDCDDSKKSKTRATITAITAASPPVVTAASHGFVTGDIVTLYEISGMTELNFRTCRLTRVDANSFSLQDFTGTNIDASSYTAYTSGGYAHHRGVTLTNCQKVLSANWHGYNRGMSFIGNEQIEAQASWMDVSRSRPIKMMHRKTFSSAGTQYDHLLWYQAADAAYNLRVWTEKQPARLSAIGDIPNLPFQFHDSITAGSITRLVQSNVQVESGVIWPSLYKAHIDAIKAYNRQWWSEHEGSFGRSELFLA